MNAILMLAKAGADIKHAIKKQTEWELIALPVLQQLTNVFPLSFLPPPPQKNVFGPQPVLKLLEKGNIIDLLQVLYM